jgi:hypothetical protein
MTSSPSARARPLPWWLAGPASFLIVAHLTAILALALAVPSGPWPSNFGIADAQSPPFAQAVANFTTPSYLQPLKLTHTYHFVASRPAVTGVFFEVRLKDQKGAVVKTLRFPDKDANFWVRHRQQLLASNLILDIPVEPRTSEVIPAPNQRARTVDIWDGVAEWNLVIRSVPEHLLPRDRQVMRPSPWSTLLARSYVRHLCRQHGAASGELIRHTREPLAPGLLALDELPPAAFAELVSNFGEVSK